jgi:hypothetical protein
MQTPERSDIYTPESCDNDAIDAAQAMAKLDPGNAAFRNLTRFAAWNISPPSPR